MTRARRAPRLALARVLARRAVRPLLPFALLALLLGTGRAPAAPAQPSATDVILLLTQLRVEEAESLLASVPPADPARPWAQAAVHFHRGRHAQASAALPAEPPPPSDLAPWLASMAEAVRGAAEATAGMQEKQVGRFLLRWAPGVDEVLPEYAGEALEGERIAMKGLLGVDPKGPITVEFYPDLASFVRGSGLPEQWVETTGTVANARWDRLMVLSPANRPHGYPWMDTLAHEYVHLALSRASWDRAPVWFQEGSAALLSAEWRGGGRKASLSPRSESLLAKALEEGRLVPFAQMHPSMAALPSMDAAQLAFAQVTCAVEYLVRQAGAEGYRRVVEDTRLHGDVMRAIDGVLGPSGGRFEARYEKDLAARGFRVRAAIGPIDAALAPGSATAPDPRGEALDPVLLADQRMKDYVRIGDLLRLRGHMEAALIEYGTAERTGPFRSPALANKQARALRGLGRPDEARDVLRGSVEEYPDFTPTLALLSELAAQAGDDRTAAEVGERAVRLNPFDPGVHAGLLAVYERTARADAAARERRALEILGGRQWQLEDEQ